MVEHIPNMEPHFVVDENAPDVIRERALALDRAIKEKPTQYLLLLADMGRLAVSFATGEGVPVEGDEIAKVNPYFSERTDKYVEFDAETEHSFEVNNRFIQLQNERRRAAKSGSKAHQEQVRSQLRFFRLEHYIERVMTWQERQEKQVEGTVKDDPKAQAVQGDLDDIPRPAVSEDNLRTAS